jgi:hypothetical protein
MILVQQWCSKPQQVRIRFVFYNYSIDIELPFADIKGDLQNFSSTLNFYKLQKYQKFFAKYSIFDFNCTISAPICSINSLYIRLRYVLSVILCHQRSGLQIRCCGLLPLLIIFENLPYCSIRNNKNAAITLKQRSYKSIRRRHNGIFSRT